MLKKRLFIGKFLNWIIVIVEFMLFIYIVHQYNNLALKNAYNTLLELDSGRLVVTFVFACGVLTAVFLSLIVVLFSKFVDYIDRPHHSERE